MNKDLIWPNKFDDDLIKVERLDYILSFFKPKIYHPDDPRYLRLWRQLKKRCVEGIWVEQFNGFRYVPGRLGFFGVFGRFEDWDQKTKSRIIIIPKVRDLEWHRAYYRMEADGFSGWENDDKYTSDRRIFEVKKNTPLHLPEEQVSHMMRSDGRFKEYIPARENLFMIHDRDDLGKPLYWNDAKNYAEMGSRGGGKSYFSALGDILPDICFDGAKYYEPGENNPDTIAQIEVTSGGGGKSTELLDKVEFGMKALASPDFPELGVWGRPGDDDYEPCPFYKRMEGSTKANNKENPWINEFKVKIGNRWDTYGTGSRVYNSVYSANQRAGAQKSAGGRRTYVLHEEWGLNEELIDAWGSNEGMVTDGGRKMAPQKGIGTSGNAETVIPSQKIFTNPLQFNCLRFKYREDPEGEFGWMLYTWMVDNTFKDENGNTDEKAAKEFHWNRYNEAKEKMPEVFINHRMNYPMKIEDMWMSNKGHYLPVAEAEEREKQLRKGNLYRQIGTAIKLHWDSNAELGVNYEVDLEAQPFYEWPLEVDRSTKECVFMMYTHPDKLKLNGVIPNDAVIVTHDPYISEEIDAGGSLGVSHFWANPKYIPHGLPGNTLLATLIGKSSRGTDGYNEILEMGMQFYGNPIGGLWYEANRGDKVAAHFKKKKKVGLLCIRPQFEQGQYLFVRKPTQTGYIVGNNVAKISLLDSIRDWLLEETELTIDGETEVKRNIERIPCLFTIKQIKQYRIDGNFDAVSSMQGLPLAIGEQEYRIAMKGESQSNPFLKWNSKLKNKYERAYI